MKIFNYDGNDDDTVYAFSFDKRTILQTEESPTKKTKSTAYTVPKYNSSMMSATKKELRNDDTIIAAINAINCGLSFIQHNLYFKNNCVATDFVNYLRILIVVLSFSSILWLIRRYEIKLIMLLIRYRVSIRDTVFSTGLYKTLCFEIIIALIVVPPYYDYTFDVKMLGYTITYSLSAIFTFISLIKLYVLVRLFGHYTEYTQEKAEKICSKHAVSADSIFALKCYTQESPFIGIGIFFFSMSIVFSFSMMLSEEPDRIIFGSTTSTSNVLKDLWNDLWVVFYTTTTIGYGNIVPYTHFGRAAAIISCILGNMYLGMLVVSIHQTMEHDGGQNLSYAWISRSYIKKDIRKHARDAIRQAAKLFLLNKRWNGRVTSPIKPNGLVNYQGKIIRNDMASLNKEQYLLKVKVYRQLKRSLNNLKDCISESREIGQNDFDVIREFEDIVRIEFPIIIKRLKNKVTKQAVEISDDFGKACKPLEAKASAIKDFTKAFKRKLSHAVKRKTLIPSSSMIVPRNNHRNLTTS